MNILHLTRLSEVQLVSGPAPWDWTPAAPLPAEIRGSKGKKARDAWANNPSTVSNFYTGYEGLNPAGRIRQGSEDDCNPPVREHFLVADYDYPSTEAEALAAAKAFNPRPNRLEKTLSGNWRAIWFLEVPVVIPSYEWAKAFKKSFSKFAFIPDRMLTGFDAGAWQAPERFWTNSGEWFVIHDEKIPAERVVGWQFIASQKFNFRKAFKTAAIPAEVVAPELESKYPRFAEWPSEFALDSQGPTFWVDGSTSPKSAIVRETGMQTFAEHAGKGFFTWTELLGAAFTKTYEADSVGRAVEGIYYDHKNYWILEDCGWQSYTTTDISRILRVDRGVSGRPDASGISDIDRTIRHIQRTQTVLGAAPFICRRPGIVTINGDRFLNTHTKPFMRPAPGTAVWGSLGGFPFISNFLERLFDRGDKEQLQSFLSWLAHFYKSGINYEPTSGLLVVLAGEAGVGKSFLVQGIMGPIFGGVGEAAKLLSGEDAFGSENFAKAVWSLDDAKTSSDYVGHKKLSEGLKRAVANDAAVYHVKYQVPVVISWFGRVVICLNKDAESMQMLPDMEISILDKISLYHVADHTIEFPTRAELDQILVRELAFFCAFLRDFEIPAAHVGTNRFGVEPWQDPDLMRSAQQLSPASAFLDILESWKTEYFKDREPTAPHWEGKGFDLYRSMQQDDTMSWAMREYSPRKIGIHLSKLVKLKSPGITAKYNGDHTLFYTISRPTHLPLKTNGCSSKPTCPTSV